MKYIFTSNMPDATYEPFTKNDSRYEASADDFLTLFRKQKIGFEKTPEFQYENAQQAKKPNKVTWDPNL